MDAYILEYPAQGADKNKARLKKALHELQLPLDQVAFEYVPEPQLIFKFGPESVPFERLPDDVQTCHIKMGGRYLYRINIGKTKLTATPSENPPSVA